MVYDRVIEGLTVRLRAVEEKDALITYKMRSDPEKTRFVHAHTGTVADQLSFIRAQRKKEGDYLFLVEDWEGNPIGMKGIYGYDPFENVVETGRFISYGSQIQNIEALYLSFDFSFDYLKVDKIIMSALENNTVMLGIQRKFGVKETHRIFNEDFGCDSIYSVLVPEVYTKTRPRAANLVKRFSIRN